MLGIIGGTSLLDYKGSNLNKHLVNTPYGSSWIFSGENFRLVLRHQFNRAPHIVNYSSHIAALKLSGADRIIAFASTGSLRPDLKPGTRLIPDDFITVDPVPTIFNHSIGHVLPVFDNELRNKLIILSPDATTTGTYLQTSGPRLETKSEISWSTGHADVVGMTLGNELSIATEMKLPMAAVCTIDNYANGICNASICYDDIVRTVRANQDKTLELLSLIISLEL
jgi:5'-methylthioadenosine phosphorylase